jgi:hypothetical protein
MYHQVVDAFTVQDNNQQAQPNDVGNKFILPATFQGSSRDMMENLQNSLAISRKYGNASMFITMTANPKWKEITEALLSGKTAADYPDIVSCVWALC